MKFDDVFGRQQPGLLELGRVILLARVAASPTRIEPGVDQLIAANRVELTAQLDDLRDNRCASSFACRLHLEEDNHIDGLADEPLWRPEVDLEQQVFEASEREPRGVGVDGREATSMPRVPRLEERERFTSLL